MTKLEKQDVTKICSYQEEADLMFHYILLHQLSAFSSDILLKGSIFRVMIGEGAENLGAQNIQILTDKNCYINKIKSKPK